MQDIRNAFEIKKPAWENSFVYTENAKSKPQGNHKQKIYLRYTDREEIGI